LKPTIYEDNFHYYPFIEIYNKNNIKIYRFNNSEC